MRLTAVIAAAMVMGGCPAALGQATTTPATPGAPIYEPPRARDDAGLVTGPGRVGWWNDAVFYQVFVRSFADSAAGPLAGDGVGDLRGLIDRLDYLNDGNPDTHDDLGVTALWLMPINPSPSYHGYDVTDYRGVNPDYGTLNDLRDLVRACHARGMRVIIDLVLNHTSDKHPWFIEAGGPSSARRGWYIWSDTDPGYAGPWNQVVWHSVSARSRRGEPARAPFYYGLFGRGMPDLNYREPQVTREMLGVVRFWLDRDPGGPDIGLDGFRLDAIRHLIEDGRAQDNTRSTHEWLADFYRAYKQTNPEAMAVGEVWASTPIAASYVGGQMDMTFEFDLASAMIEAARRGLAEPIASAQARTLRYFPPNQYGRFLTNHDQVRVATELRGDPGRERVAASLLLLGPGVPFVYYAEELGQPGAKPDPELRTPMPWTDTDRGFTTGKPWHARVAAPPGTTVEAQSRVEGSLLSHYRRLIALRRSTPSIAHGGYAPASADAPAVYAFVRPPADGEEGAPALVVINFGAQDLATVNIDAGPSLPDGWRGAEALGGSAGEPATSVRGAVMLKDLKAYQTRVYIPRPDR